MKVTFYAPYALWSPHFETELELMELHLEQGDEVTMITCDAAFSFCEANQERDFSICAQCIGRAQEGLKHLSGPVNVIRLSELMLDAKAAMQQLRQLPRTYGSFDTLYALKVDHFDLGAAVLSTLNSVFEDPLPDPSADPDLTWDTLASAFAAYAALDLYLQNSTCHLFYFCNGRLANFRAALRACNKHKVRCLVHERGAHLECYSLAENTMPHDPDFIRKYVAETLQKAESFEQKQEAAKVFYAERREGKIANWVSYTDSQIRGSVPPGWLESPVRIAMFSSTESEFSCLREYYPPTIYSSQIEGLEMILQELARRDFSGIFAVRMHPNSAGTRSDFTKRLSGLQYPFLRVVAPEEKLDSYALLQTAHKVLTWGSTIGIEAAYWRIPSIVAGWGEYMALGSTYNPTSHAELMDLLLGPLQPKPIAGAIDYGFYAKNFGTPLKYVTPWGPFFALFKGKPIRPAHLNKAFASEKPNRFQKLQRSLWTKWNQKRLNALYEGRQFILDPAHRVAAREAKTSKHQP